MSEPEVAKKGPYIMELEPGSYWWCSCGRSSKQPLCDGAHKDTDCTPLQFEITEAKKVALCGCKRTANPPYCDGTHEKL